MARRRPDPPGFGGEERLVRFVESEWPPVEGECLEHWMCADDGYRAECVAREGPCGHRFYASEHDPVVVAVWRRDDARRRWISARKAWLDARGLVSFGVWLDDMNERRQERQAALAQVDGPA
jgi:hypothetical protein